MRKDALTERDLKAKVLHRLREDGAINSKTIITSELLIPNASSRVDLAILSDEFVGIEIKSELDTLRRLPRQLLGYKSIFDKVILVIAEKHWSALSQQHPTHIEIWRMGSEGNLIAIEEAINEGPPPEKISLTSLMTKREKKRFAATLEGSDAERASFSLAFQERFQKTSSNFWAQTRRRVIKSSDLELLSRFREKKIELDQKTKDRNVRLSEIMDKWLTTRSS